eukprot:Skav236695  [mRNA]  locus=scaffold4101:12447:12722:+ [translate_table: standard]
MTKLACWSSPLPSPRKTLRSLEADFEVAHQTRGSSQGAEEGETDGKPRLCSIGFRGNLCFASLDVLREEIFLSEKAGKRIEDDRNKWSGGM